MWKQPGSDSAGRINDHSHDGNLNGLSPFNHLWSPSELDSWKAQSVAFLEENLLRDNHLTMPPLAYTRVASVDSEARVNRLPPRDHVTDEDGKRRVPREIEQMAGRIEREIAINGNFDAVRAIVKGVTPGSQEAHDLARALNHEDETFRRLGLSVQYDPENDKLEISVNGKDGSADTLTINSDGSASASKIERKGSRSNETLDQFRAKMSDALGAEEHESPTRLSDKDQATAEKRANQIYDAIAKGDINPLRKLINDIAGSNPKDRNMLMQVVNDLSESWGARFSGGRVSLFVPQDDAGNFLELRLGANGDMQFFSLRVGPEGQLEYTGTPSVRLKDFLETFKKYMNQAPPSQPT
jgi:hypothetical protein